jgi:hypothetical protein
MSDDKWPGVAKLLVVWFGFGISALAFADPALSWTDLLDRAAAVVFGLAVAGVLIAFKTPHL